MGLMYLRNLTHIEFFISSLTASYEGHVFPFCTYERVRYAHESIPYASEQMIYGTTPFLKRVPEKETEKQTKSSLI